VAAALGEAELPERATFCCFSASDRDVYVRVLDAARV
jgi:hypothetical protein